MWITKVLAVPGAGAYYYEDVGALQTTPVAESERLRTPGQTPGFRFLREVAEVVSIGLVFNDGSVAWGDCVAVSYSGKAGRQVPFRAAAGCRQIQEQLAPALSGLEVRSLRHACAALAGPLLELHGAVAYGVSQALLQALSREQGCTMAEVLAREWGLPRPDGPVPLHGSSGNDRERNADKMIIRGLPSLPHGQVDDIPGQLGRRGEVLLDYARWLRARIRELGGDGYAPTIHLDVHGALGAIFDAQVERVADYLAELCAAVAPLPLRIESALLCASQDEQLRAYAALRQAAQRRGLPLAIVADEWANTLDDIRRFADSGAVDMVHVKMPDLGSLVDSVKAVLTLRRAGVQVLLGGSCIETELSTRAAVHVALATRPTLLLARPGMGIDEALMLTENEMQRALAEIALRS